MLGVGQKRQDGLKRGDRLSAWGFRFAQQLLSLLGPRFAFWAIRRTLLPLIRRSSRPKKIRRNIDKVYSDASEKTRAALVAGVVTSIPDTFSELMLQPYWRRRVDQHVSHNFDQDWFQPYAKNEHRALFVLGHFVGWEMSLMAMSRKISNVWVLYAPPKNPLMEPIFREQRVCPKKGWRLIPRDLHNLQGALSRHLREGGSLLYLLDTPLPGPMLPFLGLTSPTALAPYQMAARQGAPLIPLKCQFQPKGPHLQIGAQQPIFADGKGAEAAQALATQMNAVYSDWIRERPTQWYWTGKFFEPNAQWEARKQRSAQSSNSTSQ